MTLVKQPEPFRFEANVAEQWALWKQRLTLFLEANSPKATANQKGATLLSCIGDEGLRIYNSFSFEDETKRLDFAEVTAKFDAYCHPRKNVVFERHKFFKLEKGELGVDAFLVALRNQAANCEFKELDEMLRDKLVFSLRKESEAGLKRTLLEDDALTLETAVKKIQLFESSRRQLAEMTTPSTATSTAVDHVQVQRRESSRKCRGCGKTELHKRSDCPAQGHKCYNCGKQNHWAEACEEEVGKAKAAPGKKKRLTRSRTRTDRRRTRPELKLKRSSLTRSRRRPGWVPSWHPRMAKVSHG
jgi:predicted RNA-binding Zn-ribbon protein involved in translation (DUF1610 family)